MIDSGTQVQEAPELELSERQYGVCNWIREHLGSIGGQKMGNAADAFRDDETGSGRWCRG